MNITMAVMNDVVHDQRVIKEARSLTRAGYRVTVVGLMGDGTPTHEIRDSVSIFRIVPFRFARNRFKQVFEIIRYYLPIFTHGNETQRRMYRLVNDIPTDFYHAHDLDTLGICAKAAKSHNAKFIYDSHELYLGKIGVDYPNRVLRWMYKMWLLWYFGRIERHYIRKASGVITVNNEIALQLSTKYGIAKPVILLNTPNLTPLDRAEDLVKKFNLSADATIVLYQGTADKSLALEETIESLSYLPDNYHLLMYLACSAERKLELQGIVNKSALNRRVILHDPVSFDLFGNLNPGAHVGIIPLRTHLMSYQLALPNKLFQYAMAGLPVVATRLPVMTEFIERHDIGRLFYPVTPKAIADTILVLIRDPKYTEIRLRARSIAEKYFNWEIEEKKLVALYRDLE